VTDLRRLQYFLGVAQERNFTRAAERLHVAQPALSRQVRQLERELGVELLHRTTHEVELTEAGRFLLERGPALLAGADELWRGVRGYGNGERGTVVVAYGASASYETAPRLLRALAERRPEIAVTTRVNSVAEILAGLADGSIDLGIVRCPPARPDLEPRTIRRERQGLLLRRDHPLAARPEVALAELDGEPLLMHPREANPGHYDAIVGLFHAHGVEPRVRLRTLTFDLAYTPVASGEAVTVVGESLRAGLPGELCWVPLVPEVAVPVSLVARRHKRSPAAVGMLETATEIARELGWIRPGDADPH